MTIFGVHFSALEIVGGLSIALPFALVAFNVIPFRQGIVMAVGWQVFVLGLVGVISEMSR